MRSINISLLRSLRRTTERWGTRLSTEPQRIQIGVLHRKFQTQGLARKCAEIAAVFPSHNPTDLVADDLGTFLEREPRDRLMIFALDLAPHVTRGGICVVQPQFLAREVEWPGHHFAAVVRRID